MLNSTWPHHSKANLSHLGCYELQSYYDKDPAGLSALVLLNRMSATVER
jgi:hypothetical protein